MNNKERHPGLDLGTRAEVELAVAPQALALGSPVDQSMMIKVYHFLEVLIFDVLTMMASMMMILLRSFLGGPDFGGPVADGNIRVLNSVECGGEIFSLR